MNRTPATWYAILMRCEVKPTVAAIWSGVFGVSAKAIPSWMTSSAKSCTKATACRP